MRKAGSLIDRFGITLGSVVAICGSGGKSTLLYRMADAAAERGWRVLCSSTVAGQMAPGARWFLYCTKATTPERRQADGSLAELLGDTPFQIVVADLFPPV